MPSSIVLHLFFEIESLTECGVGNIAGWRALRIHLSLSPSSLDVNDVLLHLAVYVVAGDRNSGVSVHVLSQSFTNLAILLLLIPKFVHHRVCVIIRSTTLPIPTLCSQN